MQTYSVNEFRSNLKKVADLAVSRHEPVRISRRSGSNLVLISEEDWSAEQETLYVLQNQKLMTQIAKSLSHTALSRPLTQEETRAEFDI